MGGSIGCECTDNRHDAVNPEVLALAHQAALAEEAGTSEIGFNGGTPRAFKGTAVELEKRRQAAQAWLVTACNSNDPDVIQNAIIWAKDVGISQAQLDDATAIATRLNARRRARDALAEAVQEGDEASLREAVSLADKAGIDTSEFEQAVQLIEELDKNGLSSRSAEEARRRALASLEKAMTSRGQQELQKAIAEAERAGLGTKSERAALAQARVMFKIVTARKEAAQKRRAQDNASGGKLGDIIR